MPPTLAGMKHTRPLCVLLFPLLFAPACHHFAGEQGVLGFATGLVAAGGASWDPSHPVAAGARVEVYAVDRLDLSDEERPARGDRPLDLSAAVTGALLPLPPGEAPVAFTGDPGASGAVLFWGEARDRFSVRFSEADVAVLRHPLDAPAGVPTPDGLALLEGAPPVGVVVELRDADGEALGFPVRSLSVGASGGVSAWLSEEGGGEDGAHLHLSADGDGAVRLLVDGVGEWTLPVDAVTAEEATGAERTVYPLSAELSHSEVVLRDGARLLGPATGG